MHAELQASLPAPSSTLCLPPHRPPHVAAVQSSLSAAQQQQQQQQQQQRVGEGKEPGSKGREQPALTPAAAPAAQHGRAVGDGEQILLAGQAHPCAPAVVISSNESSSSSSTSTATGRAAPVAPAAPASSLRTIPTPASVPSLPPLPQLHLPSGSPAHLHQQGPQSPISSGSMAGEGSSSSPQQQHHQHQHQHQHQQQPTLMTWDSGSSSSAGAGDAADGGAQLLAGSGSGEQGGAAHELLGRALKGPLLPAQQQQVSGVGDGAG